jgi:hypothetical protein
LRGAAPGATGTDDANPPRGSALPVVLSLDLLENARPTRASCRQHTHPIRLNIARTSEVAEQLDERVVLLVAWHVFELLSRCTLEDPRDLSRVCHRLALEITQHVLVLRVVLLVVLVLSLVVAVRLVLLLALERLLVVVLVRLVRDRLKVGHRARALLVILLPGLVVLFGGEELETARTLGPWGLLRRRVPVWATVEGTLQAPECLDVGLADVVEVLEV